MKEQNNAIANAYWKENKRYLFLLLIIWFAISFGAGILFEEQLSQFKIGGLPLGFWFAQQGGVYGFVILVFVYIRLMNKLDKKYGFQDDEADDKEVSAIEHQRNDVVSNSKQN